MLRVQLINNIIGSKILEIADPVDINALTQTYKRSESADGVFYEIIFDLEFIKDGREFIWAAYEKDAGIDTVVTVNLYERNPNLRKWILAGTGQVNYNRFELTETSVTVNIEQTGIERRVTNLMEVEVDLETLESENGTALPAQTVYSTLFHSKKLLLQFKGEGTEEEFDIPNAAAESAVPHKYIQFPLVTTFDEIEVRQDYPLGFSDDLPMDIKKYNWRVKVGGQYTINLPRLAALIVSTNTDADADWTFEFLLVFGKAGAYTTRTIFTETKPLNQPFDVDEAYSEVLNLADGDEIYVYGHLDLTFFTPYPSSAINYRNYTFDGPLILNHSITLDAETLFKETRVNTILIYEAIERCLQYYTNQTENVFRSSILGRVDRGYDVDGEFAFIGITNGHRLRQKNISLPAAERGDTVFANLKDLIQFVKVIACADFGFELDENGNKIFVLEKKEYFYNKDLRIASLGRVYDVQRKVLPKLFYNQIEIGYSADIDVKQINAIDEFNTIRKWSIPIINTKNQLVLTTEMITSGYLIESQRRLEISTEDGKYDDRNFAIVLLPDGASYKSKKDEGYTAITGVLFEDTGYNYDLSPARIVRNWLKVIASSLIRSRSKTLKFTFGTVNYIMTSIKDTEVEVVAENGSIEVVDVEPIWDNEGYNFNQPVTREIVELMRNNQYGYFEFLDKDDNIMQGFISPEGVVYDQNKKTAEFNLLKVYRP